MHLSFLKIGTRLGLAFGLLVLMMLGITPGPLLMTEQPAKVYMIIVGLFFANAFMALCGFAGIRIFTKISSVPSIVLTPMMNL